MRRWPTVMFLFVVLVGVARLFAYAGMPFAQELSLAAVVHYVALHAMTFALAGLVVASMSRATTTRAAQVALYAQGILFLAPFVDVGLGIPVDRYDATYTGVFGSPGAVVAALAYGAVIAWGAWDASAERGRQREVTALVTGAIGAMGLSIAAIPWPAELVALSWGTHLTLAVYFILFTAGFERAAIRFANPALHRQMWAEVQPLANAGFSILPLVGVAAAGRLTVFVNPPIVGPYAAGAAAVGALLFIQWRLVRSTAWAPVQREAAAVAKLAAVSLALLLGVGPFLAAGLAGSVLWLGRSRGAPLAFGAAAGLAVLVGDLAVPVVDVAATVIGPLTFLVPVGQFAAPSGAGIASAAAVSLAATVGFRLTSRTSA